jgi:Ribonuclease G/E
MTIDDGTDDMGRTTIQVTDELLDELFERKNRGDTYEDVIWRLIEESGTRSSVSDPEGEGGGSAHADRRGERGENHTVREEAEHSLRELGLPGRGEKLESRIEALLEMHDLLREREGSTIGTSQLKEIAVEFDHGYTDVDSFWTNCVKKNSTQGRENALTTLPGIHGDSSGEYTYESDELDTPD